jgi:cytochrome c-type biogenesis protein CcmH
MNPMWQFVAVAAALCILVLGVLGWALRSAGRGQGAQDRLLQANASVYKDQLADLERERDAGVLSLQEFETAREELQSRLLQDVEGLPEVAQSVGRAAWVRSTGLGLLVLVPGLAFSLYFALGQPAALDPRVLAAGAPEEHVTPEKIERMARDLRDRLAKAPDQVEDWVMLARVERALEHFDAAQQAMASALKLSYDPDWAIERAEILATRDQGRFEGEPWQIIRSVLKDNPQHLGALLLAGSASYAQERYAQALDYWLKANALVPPQSPDRQPLDAALAEVRAKLGQPDPNAKSLAASTIQGRVSIDAQAAKNVRPDDTVFIYATAPDSRMPLAIVRLRAADLPRDFTLDDRNAMNPQARLSDAKEVVLRARLSRSGQAQAQPDDLQAEQAGVHPPSKGVQLILK